ncbi:MAG TPA: phosphatase PAP2 family protein [Alloacidobacterium sp.]|nr:phosphatase PAP2 family protein [Alloacidobacterium sp.]
MYKLFRLNLLLLCLLCAKLQAQTTSNDECGPHSIKPCFVHLAQDQVGIITSPFRISGRDLLWIAPFGVATGLAIDYDAHLMRDLGSNPDREDKFKKFSDYTTYAASAAPIIGYGIGWVKKDDYLKESSVLAGEATLDAIIINQGLKYALDRERPNQGDGTGRFWPHGPKTWPDGQSMPSNHCMIAWSFARVVAGQYNAPGTKIAVYSLATAVSVSRVLSREHFPSDVIVGSGLGYFIGSYVFHRRSREASLFSLSTVNTINGRGMQLDINLGRH